MEKYLTIYHGSNKIIENPSFGLGKKNNDFGLGFYCTESNDLAKEWAVNSLENGYSNEYKLNIEYLKVLNLNTNEYSILNWIAILVEHRLFSIDTPIAKRARRYLIENFSINVNAYDVIIGYRADDSYFDYAEAFLNNSISVSQLANAMRLGKLWEQIVIKSEYAFKCLEYVGYEIALKDVYYEKRVERNNIANISYQKMIEKEDIEGLYIRDIINGDIKNDDSRIPRMLSK